MSEEKPQISQQKTQESNNSSAQDNKTNLQQETKQVQTQLQNLTIDKPQEQPKSQSKSENQPQSTELTETKYFVEINRTNIMFGKTTLFPGSIEQFDVSIGLKDQIIQDNGSNPYMLRVIAKCNNAQFNDLDQYVYSVRSNQRFQYFEEVRFKIRKKQRAQVKVAVKIPPVRQNYTIQGFLQIQLQSLEPVCLPIYAKCQVPNIVCIKDLYKPDEDTPIIKIPAKKNQIRMPPIPFKNMSNFNFTLQVQAISNQNFNQKPYDIITQNFVNCQANSQFFINLQLKQNMGYKGVMPVKDYIRSSIYYNYPIQVFVFQSSINAGNG